MTALTSEAAEPPPPEWPRLRPGPGRSIIRAMALSPDDRAAIVELISLHGHLFDDGDLDRLDILFTPSVVYDVSELGPGDSLRPR